MRFLLLCALVATAVFAVHNPSSRLWNDQPLESSLNINNFKTGVEYRFHYDVQITSGLPIPGSDHALTRGQALVSLVFQDDHTALLQLQKVRSASIQKQLEEPKEMQPFELAEEIEYNEEHLRLLRLPLRFRYERGLISDIEFDREDQPWSTNAKRAILNLLQVNLAKKNMEQSTDRHESFSYNEAAYFRAPETTLEGECAVEYTVLPSKEDTLITKSINFENCSTRVGMRHNFRFGDDCPSCQNKYSGEERNIESQTVINYRISSSSPSSFVIKEVQLRSSYVYSPMNEKETFFNTFVNSKLILIEVINEKTRLSEPKSEEKESLLYSLQWAKDVERFVTEGDDTSYPRNGYTSMQNKPEIVGKLVKGIMMKSEKEENGIELTATHDFSRLVKVLRMTTKEELRHIHNEVCEKKEEDEKRQSEIRDIINDALAMAGTANTVEHLMEKIRNKKISSLKTATIFNALTNIRIPSEKIIDSMIKMCKEQSREALPHQSCWLSVGGLLNGLCGEHRDKQAINTETSCPRNLKEKYVKEITSLYEKASTRYEKILALKTFANSGMDLIVFPLEKIIKDSREEKTVRVQAIEALRKLRSVMPRKIHSILLPLYKSKMEKPEVRIAAFHQVMQTVPDRVVIDQIAEQLSREPSHQVHSYVYSALVQLSKSTIPCEKRMADDIEKSLSLTRSTSHKMFDSHYRQYTMYSDHLKSGASLNWGALFSNDSILPKEVMTTLETTFGGQWNRYLAQIGFSQENIDNALSKIIKMIDEKGMEEVLVRGKRSSFSPSEMLRDLFSKLSIKTRKQMESDPHALIYFRFRDLDYALLPIDEDVIPDAVKSILRNGRIQLGEMESFLAKGYRFSTIFSSFIYERSRHLATSSGLPMVITSKMPTIINVNGNIQAELSPKNGESIDGLRLSIQANPSIASTHITDMEILCPIVSHGIKLLHSVQSNIPIDVSFDINWEKKWQTKTMVNLPEKKRRLGQIETRPVVFTRINPKETRVYVEPKEKTIYVEELESLVHKIDKTILEKETGVRMRVEGHVHGHLWENGMERLPSALLAGHNLIDIHYDKTEETPKQIVLQMNMEYFQEEKRMEQPQFDNFYENNNEEHFETEKSEWKEENEKERRSSFNDYLKNYKSTKAYRHTFNGEIRTVGGRKEKMGKIELETICDEKMRTCRMEVKAERTPIEEETRNWKMDSFIKFLYPQVPASLEELLEQKHREVIVEMEWKWGEEKENVIRMKMQGEQNKEQKKWMKHTIEMKMSEEKLTPLEEYSRLLEASMLNQYKMIVKYNIKSSASSSFIDKAYSLLKWYTPFLNTQIDFVHNDPHIIRATMTIEPETRQYLNVTMDSPSERLFLRDLRLPFPLRIVNIRRQSSHPIRSLSHLSSSLINKAQCLVEASKVNSFDDVIYRMPMNACYTVLAKDCSSKEPEFAVLMKKTEKKNEDMKMKIINRKTVIELEKRQGQENINIYVNGEEMRNEEKLEKERIFVNGKDLVTVQLEDIEVHFDGYTAELKMSEMYKNKQCGVCGHYDGEKKNELRKADNEETDDIEEFHRSFLLKEDKECEMEENELKEKKNYRMESEESSEETIWNEKKWMSKGKKMDTNTRFENDKEIVDAVKKTRVIEYSNRVCFSTHPVLECPRKTFDNDKDSKEIKVKFTCMARSSVEAQRLLRDSRHKTLSLEKYNENYTETMTIPSTCIVY